MENGVFVIVITLVLVMSLILGLAMFNGGIDNSWRDQIVQHGCAEYYLDGKNDRQWRWKE